MTLNVPYPEVIPVGHAEIQSFGTLLMERAEVIGGASFLLYIDKSDVLIILGIY